MSAPRSGASPWRWTIRTLGTLVTLASIGYVLHRVVTADWSVLASGRGTRLILLSIGATVLHGAAGFVLALAWWRLLTTVSKVTAASTVTAARGRIVAVYATTQIYKYLPTNVLHFVGRHAATRVLGLPDGRLAAAATMEVAGLVLAAGLIALATGGHLISESGTSLELLALPRSAWILGAGVAAAGVLVVGLAVRRKIDRARLAGHLGALGQTLLLYLLFFAISGGILYLVARHGLGLARPSAVAFLPIAAVGWLLGFVMPGAPAGLGVRDAVTIMLLAPAVGQAPAVAVAGLFRAATLAGDGLFAAAGLLLRRTLKSRRENERSDRRATPSTR